MWAMRGAPAGFILTGGRSSRMGRDKALLPYRGGTLAAFVASIVRQVADPVYFVGKPNVEHAAVQTLVDLAPDFGPVGGIATALGASTAEWNVIVACDMPGLDAQFLKGLTAAAIAADAQCALAETSDGRWHPLCAVYRRSALSNFETALRKGEHKLMQVVEGLRPTLVRVDNPLILKNVNTPEEWNQFARA